MELALLGTGSPIPTPERAGSCVAVEVAGEPVLVDCGPGATRRMVEHGVDPAAVERLFLTHHHVDHDADLLHFVISSWSLGRESLLVYGPPGVEERLDAIHRFYAEDIDYRRRFYDDAGIDDVAYVETTPDLDVATDGWRATALPVEHSIETYAYRFDADAGSVVVSGDTTPIPELAEFAAGADVLVMDACVVEAVDPPDDPPAAIPDRLLEPLSDEHAATLRRTHSTPAEAGEVAADAGVGTLVLTHMLPYRDTEAARGAAASTFDGEVVVAGDGTRLSV